MPTDKQTAYYGSMLTKFTEEYLKLQETFHGDDWTDTLYLDTKIWLDARAQQAEVSFGNMDVPSASAALDKLKAGLLKQRDELARLESSIQAAWAEEAESYELPAIERAYRVDYGMTETKQIKTMSSAGLTQDGMYKQGDRIFKVQRSPESGHLYAKELIACESGKHSFEYAQGWVKRLRAEDRMTLEQAKEFGVLYGVCCVCGRTLTNEDSIEAGIGPICASKL